jgi:hypothetical protein
MYPASRRELEDNPCHDEYKKPYYSYSLNHFNRYFGEIHLPIQKSFALHLPASRIYAELHLTVAWEHTLFDAVSIFSE